MSIGDVYKLSVVGTYGSGQQFVNTFHYRQEALIIGNSPEDLAAKFEDIVLTGYAQLLAAPNVVNTLEVRQITGDPLEAFDGPVEVQGDRAGDPLPPQVSPLISWRTGLIGRRNRGRTYLPAPVENDQVAGELSVTYLEGMQNVADSMIALSNGLVTAWQLVIYGAPNPDVDPPLAENIVPVTSAVMRRDLATQRRRRIGTGS
jgi:hypothetical protein